MKVSAAFCAIVIIGAASASGVSGPVAAQPPSGGAAAPPAAQSTGRSCFWARDVLNLRSVDNRTVFVRVSRNDVFALELFAPCQGVDWAHRASLRTRGSSSICEGRANWVELHVRRPGGGRQRCSVSNIRKLTPDEIANLPRGARP